MSYSYKRTLEFLRLLTRESSFKPVHFYAKALNVSVKSVFYYLAQLDHLLDKDKYLLHKEPGKGIFLEKSQAISLEHILRENIPTHRQIKILHQLLLYHETATVKELSQIFYVSKTSIICDFKKITRDLSLKTDIEYKFHQQKIIISGSFLTLLQLHLLFIDKLFNTLTHDNFMNYNEYLAQLHDYYPSDLIDQSISIITKILNQLPQSIHMAHDINYFSLILLILLYESPSVIDFHPKLGDYLLPNRINHLLCQVLPNHLLHESIKNFVYYQLIIYHFVTPPTHHDLLGQSLENLMKLVITIMTPHLEHDSTLQEHLRTAYPTAILQAELGSFISNHHHETLKHHHATFMSIGLLLLEYHNYMWNIPYHATIACSLLAYFLMALYKYQPKSEIYLLSHLDPALHLLLRAKLQSILPTDHNLIEVTAINQVPNQNHTSISPIILSTYPIIPIPSYNFLTISPLLDYHEQQAIIQLYTSTFHGEQDIKLIHPFKKVNHSLIRRWLDPRITFSATECNIKSQIFHVIAEALFRANYSSINVGAVLKEIDEINHVDTNINWVLLHIPPQYIEKSVIIFYHNSKPILWHKHSIQHIICTGLTASDYAENMPSLLHEIYLFFRSSNYRNDLLYDALEF